MIKSKSVWTNRFILSIDFLLRHWHCFVISAHELVLIKEDLVSMLDELYLKRNQYCTRFVPINKKDNFVLYYFFTKLLGIHTKSSQNNSQFESQSFRIYYLLFKKTIFSERSNYLYWFILFKCIYLFFLNVLY